MYCLYGVQNKISPCSYEGGSWQTFVIDLTSNHRGYFEFKLCPQSARYFYFLTRSTDVSLYTFKLKNNSQEQQGHVFFFSERTSHV
jgi:hypothetical protein